MERNKKIWKSLVCKYLHFKKNKKSVKRVKRINDKLSGIEKTLPISIPKEKRIKVLNEGVLNI